MRSDPLAPSSRTTLVILLGASAWPYAPEFEDSLAYAQSATAVRTFFQADSGFGVPIVNMLDLFDDHGSADELDQKIGDFLEQRIEEMMESRSPARDLILYFIGHGGFVPNSSDYCLAIWRTRKDNIRVSSIEMVALATTLKHKARPLRRVLILDCCFAGNAFKVFQGGPAAVANTQTSAAFEVSDHGTGFPTQGTSLLCSSGQHRPALLMPDESGTMFSTALLRALYKGKPRAPRRLSLETIADLTAAALHDLRLEDAPRPEVHSPDQSEGRVERVPLFPNAAAGIKQAATTQEGGASGVTTRATATTDPAMVLVQQMTPQIEAAATAQDWLAVLDKMAFLVKRASTALSPRLYRMQAQAWLAEGQSSEACLALDAALALDPLDVPTMQVAAQVRHTLLQDAEALLLLQDALAIANSLQQRLSLLRDYVAVLVAEQQWTEALRRCEEALRLVPEDAALLASKLQVLEKLYREQEALALARTLTVRPDATVDWWLSRAQLARSVANDDNEVKVALAAAERLAPNNPAIATARRDLLPPPSPPIAPEHFPQRLASLGFAHKAIGVNGQEVEYIVPPVCEVPAGPFLMGSDPKRDPVAAKLKWTKNEQPQHSITLPFFQIARYPVTVAEYACFVRAGHQEPSNWQDQLGELDHPIVSVTWHDATAYASWLAGCTNQPWRLPTEAEWEKAARDADRRIYPWGNTFDKTRCNSAEGGSKATTPIGSYPTGASPYGVHDLAGNVWEWTSSLYKPYPYNVADGRNVANSTKSRVMRGSSWGTVTNGVRAACRNKKQPDNFDYLNGFRLLSATPIS